MKYSQALLALGLCASEVAAFPAALLNMPMNGEQSEAVAAMVRSIESAGEKRQLLPPTFNAEQQHVSTTGKHAYVAPKSSDLRGPCPGLNAMANHGYIPHNGVASITQFIEGTYAAFGMGADLAAVLAIYGAVFDGDLTSWSIGGPPPEGLVGGLLGSIGLLGQPQGISGSHNKYESDVSPTRPDLYEYGNDYKVIVSQFEDLYSQPLGPNGYDLTTLTSFRAKRFQQSIDNNPYFFNGPFTGVAVQPAAYTFIYRFMSNKSEEVPEGYLNGDVLKSFFGITGEPGSFVWKEGSERIPDNWYKRAIGDEYTVPFFNTDLLAAALEHPEFLDIGGNTGKVNTFTGVDVKDLTGGVFNSDTLLEGDNLICFTFQAAQQAAPDLLKGLFSDITKPLSQINSAFSKALSSFACPQLKSIDDNQFKKFPGSKIGGS